jgi:glycosyltransferase involved in cell wall biosynthesis
MNRTVDLSVIVPTYNHAAYLPRALRALREQTVRPAEVIVVDDCSADATPELLAAAARSDPALKVVRNERNLGVNASARRGLGLASGKYLFFAASDDRVLPEFVEKTVAALERHPRAGLCCAYFSTEDGTTGEVRENPSGWCDAPHYFPPAAAELLAGRGGIPGHATVVRRAAFEAAGGYHDDLEWGADWFVNLVVAFRDGLCHVPEMLALLTVLPGSYSARGSRDARNIAAKRALLGRVLSDEYRDVLPAFQRSGALACHGADVLLAALDRPDLWSPEVLRLLNCFGRPHYEELLAAEDPTARELAEFFLEPFREQEREMRLAAQLHTEALVRYAGGLERYAGVLEERNRDYDAEVRTLAERVRWMEGSAFWRARETLARCKRFCRRLLGGRRAA